MIRATTPKHIFVFDTDINPASYSRILITYSQNNKIIMEKEKDDLTIENNTVWFRMTQEDTNRFRAGNDCPVQVQVRVLTVAGEALASEKRTLTVQDVLNDEVLV